MSSATPPKGESVAEIAVRLGMPPTALSPGFQVVVRDGRAVAVRRDDGTEVPARRAVLADVSAPVLYGSLVATESLPDTAAI